MNAKHTKGPWAVQHGIDVTAKDAYGRVIATALPSDAVDRDEAEANARLIAASPELLEALHHISLASQNSMSSKRECGNIARTAIAKATGESQ